MGLPNISRTVKATNFKYGTEIDGGELTKKKFKIGSNGVMWGARHPILEFWDPPNISRTVEAEKFKFVTETYCGVF